MSKMLTHTKEFDRPDVPVSLGDMTWSQTGTWRYMKPKYEDKTPPCNEACPAGIDIVGFVMLVESGRARNAWLKIKEESPFPGVCGRVCPHPCETGCNRGQWDASVSVHMLERFVADATVRVKSRHLDRRESRGERVAIIGAGPAGLSCAYHLAQLGYNSEVFEALPCPGGILRMGIPAYRLPLKVLEREIADIQAQGVKIHVNTRIGPAFFDTQAGDYPAIFLATGAHRSRPLAVPGEEGMGVIPGLSFLRQIRLGQAVQVGRRVAVIGGGNTALDAARSARRLGADPIVVYRRSRDQMPAFAEEIEESLEEGVDIEFLTQPVRIVREKGRPAALECIKTRLVEPDESGRQRPVPVDGSNFTMEADSIVVAVGEGPDAGSLPPGVQADWGTLVLDEASRFESRGIFFGGDLVAPMRTVAHAVGSGKKAAIAIDTYLKGEDPSQVLRVTQIGQSGGVSMRKYQDEDYRALSRHVVSFDELNADYFRRMGRTKKSQLPVAKRIRNFREVNRGLTRGQARYEAERCLKCGTCNECENCYVFCPDASVLKRMRKLDHVIDYDICKGCGICFTECPRRAISMEEEAQ